MTTPGAGDPNEVRVAGTDRVFDRRRILVVLLAMLAMTLMAISAINVALPSIEAGIGATPTDLQWLLSGYALAFGMVLVAAGRIGDVLGHSGSFVAGVLLFTAASLASALVHDPAALNWARIVQGVGAGVASPQINGMILQYFHGRQRARAFALFGLTVSVAVAAAPALTGFLIQALGPDAGWRMSFLWNVPIGVATCLVALRWLPFGAERQRALARRRGQHVDSRIDLDPVGMVLLSVTVLCVMLPFMLKQAAGFVLLPVGAVLLVTWLAWERHHKRAGGEPMVDLSLFSYRSFTHGISVSGTLFLGATSVFAVLALYLQIGLGVGALAVGLVGLPNAIASGWSSMWTGERVLTHGRRIIVAGAAVYLAGILGSMALAVFIGSGRIGYQWLALTLVLTGTGMGAINAANQTLSQEDIPLGVGATAGAVKQVAERIGTAIGNAMITAVLFSLARTNWTTGFIGSYAVIAAILTVTTLLAIHDLRTLGDGGSPARLRTL